MMKRLFAPVAALVLLTGAALAQVPSVQPPYNLDLTTQLGTPILSVTVANASQPNLGTKNSAAQQNVDKQGVMCAYLQTASSGSSSVIMNIQVFDAASQAWMTTAATSAITNPGNPPAPWVLVQREGIATSSLPTNWVGVQLPVPRVWRVQLVNNANASLIGGTTSVTATVGCNVVK
jgi:hypothetical protein